MSDDSYDQECLLDEVPPEVQKMREANQAAFAEQWGPDHSSMLADAFGFCPSPDGHIIGIYFELKNGQTVKVSLPLSWYHDFFREVTIAGDTAIRRMKNVAEGQKQ